VFGIQSPNGFFYGFPQLDDRGVKVAEHAGNELVADPSNLTRDLTSGDLDAVQSFTRQYMPGIRQKHTHHSVCMYTMTPDKHFIVDLHPEYANVAFACGFSGHGFKFAPVIGSALADLVGKRVTTDSLDFLSLRRFLHS
jgi:sarcosine oxidase